jgi:hypothetical protein
MPLYAYQLGDVPLFHTLIGTSDKGVSIDIGRDWRNPMTELIGVGGAVSFLSNTRTLSKTPGIKIDGTLVSVPPYNITRLRNSLMSLGGRRNIPLIGFYMDDTDAAPLANLIWLYTDVMITSITPDNQYSDASNVWSLDKQPIAIEMQADTRWRPLSQWTWEYRDPFEYLINPASSENSQVGYDTVFVHPKTFGDLRECFYFYRWQSNDSYYSPFFWGMRFDGVLGGYGSDFVDFGRYEFYSDPALWSADPNSVYALTGLSNSGTVSITVKRQTGLFANDVRDEVSSLDLAVLDADLAKAGYGGLHADDIIFTGQLSPLPGFVYRNNQKLMGVLPKWSYPSSYPGETGRGYNTFTVEGTGTTGQVAFLHEYGVL